MPTRRGGTLLVGAVICYMLARALSVDELFAVAAGCVAFPALALGFVVWRRHGLEYSRTLGPKRVFAGSTTVRIAIGVRNPGRTASPPVIVEDDAPAALGGTVRLALPPLRARGRGEAVAERRAAARGAYAIGPLRARLVDPFGLARATTEVVPRATMIVYPRVEPLSEAAPREAPGGGGRAPVFRVGAAGEEFYAVRGWQDGDDLRKIHWRSTARLGELMIKQDEHRLFPRATLLVDTRASAHRDGEDGDSMEWALSAAASIVWELSRQGFGVRLATADGAAGGVRYGREAVDGLLTSLALATRSPAQTLQPALRPLAAHTRNGGALLAIVPALGADDVAALARLRRSFDSAAAVVLDAASFAHMHPRERAHFDRRIAETERGLVGAGWRVVTADASDEMRDVWQSLVLARAPRPSSPSARS